MRSNGTDQAEGLRRLLLREQTQVITVMAGKPGAGQTSVTLNLAQALANLGKHVLVVDEQDTPRNVSASLGLLARHDLLDVVQGKCAVDEVMINTHGFRVLPAARAMRAQEKWGQSERHKLKAALAEASAGLDVLLIDAAMPVPNRTEAPNEAAARESALLVVVDTTVSGITGGYALIKRLAVEDARLQFEIVVNKAAGGEAALKVFENMAQLARRNLAARLDYIGHLPRDDRHKRATQMGKPVVGAFPGAAASKSYLELAQKLLRLPMRQDETVEGARAVMRSVMGRVAQPLHNRAMASVSS